MSLITEKPFRWNVTPLHIPLTEIHGIDTVTHRARVFKVQDKWHAEVRRKEVNVYTLLETRMLKTLQKAKRWVEVTILEDN